MPLAAQAEFNAQVLPAIVEALAGGEVVLVALDFADHTHREWRRAALAMLARAHAPARVNGVAGSQGTGLEVTASYLASAPGVTGQYLELAEDFSAI